MSTAGWSRDGAFKPHTSFGHIDPLLAVSVVLPDPAPSHNEARQ